jgi:nicotinamide phosphoribosyltransferase
LYDTFGGDMTEKGYSALNQRVGLIYGDSITLERAEQILQRLMDRGFSAGNIVFGVGSYTYQYNTRDTFGMAVKATAGVVHDEFRELFKDPKTDEGGTKKSARGLLRVEKEGNDFVLYDQQAGILEAAGELKPIFNNGKVHNFQTLAQIRAVLKAS